MEERKLTIGVLKRFREELVRRERSAATVEKYMHDVRSLAVWLDGGGGDAGTGAGMEKGADRAV